jgi:hypothetical protein
LVGHFFEEHADRGQVFRRGHDVVGHLVVDHAPVLPDDLFIQRIADCLGNAAFDLSRGENRMDYLPNLLQGNKVIDGDAVSCRVDGDFSHVHRPGIGRIGLAAVQLIIPKNIGRRFVAAERLQLAELHSIRLAGGKELLAAGGGLKQLAVDQRLPHL